LLAVATLAALAVAAPSPCLDPGLGLRCPNLVMAPPSHMHITRSPNGRHVVLHMANRIVNVGAGPVEFFGQRASLSEMTARQVIVDAAGRRRRFETGAELYFKSVPTRGGSYWKFQHAARFELWAVDLFARRTQLVRVGPTYAACALVRRCAGTAASAAATSGRSSAR
jgi:hypothetical protein